jgi:hypothetical protein
MVSQANGGADHISNYIASCRECNGGKGAISIDPSPAGTHAVRKLSKSEAYTLAASIEPTQGVFLRTCSDLGINIVLFE